jgi:hypothetical protein
MIPVPSRVRVWIAAGHADMHCGMHSLALRIQVDDQGGPRRRDMRCVDKLFCLSIYAAIKAPRPLRGLSL